MTSSRRPRTPLRHSAGNPAVSGESGRGGAEGRGSGGAGGSKFWARLAALNAVCHVQMRRGPWTATPARPSDLPAELYDAKDVLEAGVLPPPDPAEGAAGEGREGGASRGGQGRGWIVTLQPRSRPDATYVFTGASLADACIDALDFAIQQKWIS